VVKKEFLEVTYDILPFYGMITQSGGCVALHRR
jgi:hypothetical protein